MVIAGTRLQFLAPVPGASYGAVGWLIDSTGNGRAPVLSPTRFLSLEEAARRVGAVAIPGGTKDISNLYHLPADTYTADISSADGTPGTGLLEVYQVPF